MSEPKIFDIPLYAYERHADQDAERPVRHPVLVVGAGPVGLCAAIDLAMQDVPVILLDENNRVSAGSRAICFAKRPLEILDRLGCGDACVDKGVIWNSGKVYFGERGVYGFHLLPEEGHRRPAFINLQQYHLEHYLIERLQALRAEGKPVEIRGMNQVLALDPAQDHVRLTVGTPEGPYEIEADWLIVCDGAKSPVRTMMGLDFIGRTFEDNFLIADVIMHFDQDAERRFWFDAPFNPGQSALMHKQPDDVWRIDLQLGWDIDRSQEIQPDKVHNRITAMLGPDVPYDLDWVSIYTFQCRRIEKFRHGRVIFAGDAAHQVSPFGARGANSGIQDTDNLCWKLKLVLDGKAPETLLDSYDSERIYGADENILNSTRSTDFITPRSEMSRLFRNAVLDLAEGYEFARPMVNSGRLSVPCVYDGSPLNSADGLPGAPERARPGASCPDAPVAEGYVLDHLGGGFVVLAIDTQAPDVLDVEGIGVRTVRVAGTGDLRARYLGEAPAAVYLIRPDQHVAGRWPAYDEDTIRGAVLRATGRG